MDIIWRRVALDNLEHARRYIARDSPTVASRVFAAVRAAVQRLATAPHLGRLGRVEGTRELVVPETPYLVAYAVIEERVVILAVLHGAQKWPDAL